MERQRVTNENKFKKQVLSLFDDEFVTGDVSIESQRIGETLLPQLNGSSSTSYHELVNFGVTIVPILEESYTSTVESHPQLLAGKVAHTLIWTQNEYRKRKGEKPMPLFERNAMLFDFSDKLMVADTNNPEGVKTHEVFLSLAAD